MVWLGIGAVLAVLYFIILVIADKKYKPYTAPLKDKEHFFKVLYPVGFWRKSGINTGQNSIKQGLNSAESCTVKNTESTISG